jgi:hypothetical protein
LIFWFLGKNGLECFRDMCCVVVVYHMVLVGYGLL